MIPMRLSLESRATIALVTLLVTAGIMVGCFFLVSTREEALRSQIRNAATINVTAGMPDAPNAAAVPLEIAPGTFVTKAVSAVGSQELKIHWQSRFAAFGDNVAWIIIFGIPAGTAALILFGFSIVRAAVIVPLRQENESLQLQVAATRDMQMFAHDVRKPFSAVKAVIEVLQQASVPDDAAKIARRLLPEINGLLRHVDQMIADMLQNDVYEEKVTAIAVDQALVEAVRESERKHPQASHNILWQLQHTRKLLVAEKDLVRAVANLLCNAIEAIGPDDRITITSSDADIQGTPAVALRVRNTGPVIPEPILKTLFTPFFTTGKQDGTGLGLAYVRQMVEQAGGTTSVTSDARQGTEFVLTLPAASSLDKLQVALPEKFNASRGRSKMTLPGGRLKILVVEDNDIYYEALTMTALDLTDDPIEFNHARTADEGLRMLSENPDILICDIDLGDGPNSLSVVKAAAERAHKPAVYIHSNTALSPLDDQFVALHTQGYLAKPVAKDALAALIASHTKASQAKSHKPKIAVIDDDCFVRELWALKRDEVEAVTFASPDEFKEAITADKALLGSFTAIVVDFYFEEANYTGEDLARELRQISTVPLIMSSDVTGLSSSAIAAFDLIVKKDCMSWDEINSRLTQAAPAAKVVS